MYGKNVIIIACITPLGVYGTDEKGKPAIPWKSKIDMTHFKKETEHNTVIMGRKTYLSLPNRTLPNREIIVVTSKTEDLRSKGVIACSSLIEAIEKAKNQKVFVIGGGGLWTLALSYANEIHTTIIDAPVSETNRTVSCKVLIDPTRRYPNFKLISERVEFEELEIGNRFTLKFCVYKRMTSKKTKWKSEKD